MPAVQDHSLIEQLQVAAVGDNLKSFAHACDILASHPDRCNLEILQAALKRFKISKQQLNN